MQTVTLYTKEKCSLCDVVKEELAALQPLHPHQLAEVDITLDPDLFDRYRYLIPVVTIGSTELRAPISRQELIDVLAKH